MLTAIITFIIVLGLLILVHELGHFVAARKLKVAVEEFGFGFPPRIAGIKRNKIIYSVNWIPIGGFVKLKGEDGEYKKESDSFAAQKIWKRFIILAAGVAMNFILAALLLTVGFRFGLPTVIDDTTWGNIRDQKIQIVSILPNSPADQVGLEIGDTIFSINGQRFNDVDEILKYNASQGPIEVKLLISRANEEKEIPLTLAIIEEGRGAKMGAGLVKTGIVSYPLFQAAAEGIKATVLLTWQILTAFAALIKDLIISQTISVDLTGPVGIAVITGKVAKLGLIYILQFAAILSINLAIINFLPFPGLDGGRVLFLLIEKIRRRPITQKIEALIHNFGFIMLILLMLVVTLRDFSRYRQSFLDLFHRIIGS